MYEIALGFLLLGVEMEQAYNEPVIMVELRTESQGRMAYLTGD